jgi:catechol 2,3-dioxygenase-like lactoylglutathione lyase family enzyme
MAYAGMHRTIPALPVRDMVAAVADYGERFGFEVLHHDGGFAVLRRDEAVIHLWESSDEEWRVAGGLRGEAGLLGRGVVHRRDRERADRGARRRRALRGARGGGGPASGVAGRRGGHRLRHAGVRGAGSGGNLQGFYRWDGS